MQNIIHWDSSIRMNRIELEILVNIYNALLTRMLPPEWPLFHESIHSVDIQLQRALDSNQLNWRDLGAREYLITCKSMIQDLWNTLEAVKRNIHTLSTRCGSWSSIPLVVRRNNKPIVIQEALNAIQNRLQSIREDGNFVHELLSNMHQTVDTVVGGQSTRWKAYIIHLDRLLSRSLRRLLQISLQYLLDEAMGSEQVEIFFFKV